MSRGQTLSENEILSLIEIFWGKNIQSMVDNTSRNRDVYNIVMDTMKRTGHDRNAYEIRTKVNNLKQWYKRVTSPDPKVSRKHERHRRTRVFKNLKARLNMADRGGSEEDNPGDDGEDEKIDDEDGNHVEEDAERIDDGSAADLSGIDTDQSTASPSAEDSSEPQANRLAVDLSQPSESRKRKRTTPDRVIIDTSVEALQKDEQLRSNSSGSEPAEETEVYPKGVVVVQPTAVEDEMDLAPAEAVVSQAETAVPVNTNQRVLFAINRNPKKTPIPILPKITAVHSGFIPTVARAAQPAAAPARHAGTPYERPQNRQRQARALPTLTPPPPPPPLQQSFDPNVLQEQQHQEEHEAKMELYRTQIELATAQLRMAEEEHRVRLAKLQVELQTAQMEHDAKATQLTPGS